MIQVDKVSYPTMQPATMKKRPMQKTTPLETIKVVEELIPLVSSSSRYLLPSSTTAQEINSELIKKR